jgi:7-carboxy-7-deazaguanine synthase
MIRNIQEIIRSTVQGEGHHAGTICSFIRLFGCPVMCDFCDTGYSDADNIRKMKKKAFHITEDEFFYKNLFPHITIVISGGEPMYHPDLPLLLIWLKESWYNIHIETSGQADFDFRKLTKCWITLSPKDHLKGEKKIKDKWWKRADEVKLVVRKREDFDFYHDLLLDAKRCYLQPEWNTHQQSLEVIMDLLNEYQAHDLKLSVQTHKFLDLP